jgi:hypothetical protein
LRPKTGSFPYWLDEGFAGNTGLRRLFIPKSRDPPPHPAFHPFHPTSRQVTPDFVPKAEQRKSFKNNHCAGTLP